MGIYDVYEGIQLKVGDVCMSSYCIGDRVDIADGVYIAPDGAVVIKDGKLLMTTDNVQDKWGSEINVEDRNPISVAVKTILLENNELFPNRTRQRKSQGGSRKCVKNVNGKN